MGDLGYQMGPSAMGPSPGYSSLASGYGWSPQSMSGWGGQYGASSWPMWNQMSNMYSPMNLYGSMFNPWASMQQQQAPGMQQPGMPGQPPSSPAPQSSPMGAPSTGGWYQNPQNQGSTPDYVSFGEDQHSPNQSMLRNWFMNSNNAAGTPQMSLMSPSDQQKFWDMPITRGAEISTVLQNEGWRNTGQGIVAPWAPQGWAPSDPSQSVWGPLGQQQAQQSPMVNGQPMPTIPPAQQQSGLASMGSPRFQAVSGTGSASGPSAAMTQYPGMSSVNAASDWMRRTYNPFTTPAQSWMGAPGLPQGI